MFQGKGVWVSRQNAPKEAQVCGKGHGGTEKENKILKAKAEMKLSTVKIDESDKEACKYLSLMRKKALNSVRAAI